MTDWNETLIHGYKRFRNGHYREQKTLYERLGTHGQSPKVMIIACADSRVDPTDIFDAYPGEMFVARNVANIVPPVDHSGGFHGTTAAIEYAVSVLKVEMILVLGHESCGGIQACLSGMGRDPDAGYIGKWVSLLNDVCDRVRATGVDHDQLTLEMELETVRQSLANLLTFPFVKDAVSSGQLKLQGAYFSIIQARLLMADATGAFETIKA